MSVDTTADAASPTVHLAARRRRRAGRIIVYTTLIAFAAFYVFPLVVMLLTSFKTMDDVRSGTLLSAPAPFTLEPWRVAWSSACVGVECIGLRQFYFNTIAMAALAVLLSTVIGAVNGYALTQFPFPRSKLVFGLILLGAFTPYQAILIPLAHTLGSLRLAGSLVGLSLVHTIYGIPFTTAFSRSFYLSLPPELVRAAKVDGAGFWRIFVSVMLPISLPSLMVAIIFQFTNIWNDFLFGSALTYGKQAPIMVALNNIVNTSTGERPYDVHMAAAILAAVPTLLLYVVAGKYFVRGLTMGSVKG
ncbi:MAG: carbohydrate ABC transporter permease [Roseiarcus sp.]